MLGATGGLVCVEGVANVPKFANENLTEIFKVNKLLQITVQILLNTHVVCGLEMESLAVVVVVLEPKIDG